MEETIIKALPKVELHCHLDGSVRPETLYALAQKQQLPISDFETFRQAITVSEECQNLEEYLQCFDAILPILQTAEALSAAAYDVVAQGAAENVHYMEIRFAPQLHTRNGLTVKEVITAVLTGLERGQTELGVKSNALLCGMRHHNHEKNNEVLKAATDFSENGVVGFDLAGDEANFPPHEFTELIQQKPAGVGLTLHAGECGCPQNVVESIHMGATRIGHGIAIKKEPSEWAALAAAGTTLEMCPTSNFHTKTADSLADYPFQDFLEAGIAISINTDNRTVSQTSLTQEFQQLSEWYGISYDIMHQLTQNSVQAAFLKENAKSELAAAITAGYQPYLSNL